MTRSGLARAQLPTTKNVALTSRAARTSRSASATASGSFAGWSGNSVSIVIETTGMRPLLHRYPLAAMDCLVTGGAGFIGSHPVDALTARGDRGTGSDNPSTGEREKLSRAP